MLCIHRVACIGMASLLMCSTAALAGNVTIPNTFTAHTPAVATQVNANFGAVATAVNGNAADIAALQLALTALQDIVTSQQTTITSLQSQLATVQGSSVMALATNLDMINVPDPNDSNVLYPTAQFHGINVRIVNGMGATTSTNGLGNLTVGYNETDDFSALFCSDGSYADQTTCETNGDTWAKNQRSGSHNLIVGHGNAYSRHGGFLAGYNNIASGAFSSVSGGQDNTARGGFSSVSGGLANTAGGFMTSISGGVNNATSGFMSSVSGGSWNNASGNNASVSGGASHTASGDYDWRAGTLFEEQ